MCFLLYKHLINYFDQIKVFFFKKTLNLLKYEIYKIKVVASKNILLNYLFIINY